MQRSKALNSRIVASCNKKTIDDFKTDVYIEGQLSQYYLVPGARMTLLETSKRTIRIFMAEHQLSRRAEPTVDEFARLVCSLGWHNASHAVLEHLLPKLWAWIAREAVSLGIADTNVRSINKRLEVGDSLWPAYTVTWLMPGWNGNTVRPAGASTPMRPIIRRSTRLGPTALVRLTLQVLAQSTGISSTRSQANNVETEAYTSPQRSADRANNGRTSRNSTTQASVPPLEPKLVDVIRRVMADEVLLNSAYVKNVGSASVEASLFHVLRQPPSFELYDALAREVQETLVEVLMNMVGPAREAFEDFFGPLGKTY